MLAGAALFAAACAPKKTEEPAKPEAAAQEAGQEKSVPKSAPKTGPVAKVNGEDIPRAAFNKAYEQTIARYMRSGHQLPDSLKERLKDNIVRRLVDAAIIEQQAKKMGVKVDPAELKKRWGEHKARYGTPEAFTAFLTRSKMSEAEVKAQFERNLVREALFKKVTEKVEVSPKQVREYYDKFKKQFNEPARVRARHILIRVKPSDAKEVKAEKRAKAEKIAKEAKKTDDAGFAKLAEKYGEDGTKSRGGDLGAFARGRMVKPFEDAAWELKKGQVSGVVETQFGYHVIRKTDFLPAKKRSFEEVKDQIERTRMAAARNKAIREAIAKWKKDAKIEIFEKGDINIIRGPQKPGLKTKKNLSKEGKLIMKPKTPATTSLKPGEKPATK